MVCEVFNSEVIIMLLELVLLILASCRIGELKRRNVLLIIGELTLTFLDQIVADFKTFCVQKSLHSLRFWLFFSLKQL